MSSTPESPVRREPGALCSLPVPAQADRRRRITVGIKFAAAVVVVVGLISGWVGVRLSQAARESLVDAKLQAVRMVVQSFVPALGPALDFGDVEAIREHAERLRHSRDVTRVEVWVEGTEAPVVRLPAVAQVPKRPSVDKEEVGTARIDVTRILRSPTGAAAGALFVEYTLAPQLAEYRSTRGRILWFTAILAVTLAAVVIGIARTSVVRPIQRLLRAMCEVESGRTANLAWSSRDEVGELARGFNRMAVAIREREDWLRAERERTQELLDNMRQAIVVVDRSGQLLEHRSRVAEQLFGEQALRGSLLALLDSHWRGDVEREAFAEWIAAAFDGSATDWERVVKLAPNEITVRDRQGETRDLELEFRPILSGQDINRIMVLCTDVTAQRHLEQQVVQKDAEHERQMRAMRALVAGGGQLLVNVLEGSQLRLEECRQLLKLQGLREETLDAIFQKMHTIKGEARVFELEELNRAAANLECEIGELRGRVKIQDPEAAKTGKGRLLPGLAAVEQALRSTREMLVKASPIGDAILEQVTVNRGDLTELERCLDRGGADLVRVVNRLTARPFGELMLKLSAAVQRWAEPLGKRVVFEVVGRELLVDRRLGQVVSAMLGHLVRNAVVHGVETEPERRAAGKPVAGRISVGCRAGEDGPEFWVKDDGQGLDEEGLGARAAAMGLGGLSPVDAAFAPGITTARDPGSLALAGRGMGLGAVRDEMATLGYDVLLRSVPGLGVEVDLRPSVRSRMSNRIG